MELKSREHAELIAQFEKDIKRQIYGARFDKEPRESWKRGIIYQDGRTNEMFLIYRLGYGTGKLTERLGLYEGDAA